MSYSKCARAGEGVGRSWPLTADPESLSVHVIWSIEDEDGRDSRSVRCYGTVRTHTAGPASPTLGGGPCGSIYSMAPTCRELLIPFCSVGLLRLQEEAEIQQSRRNQRPILAHGAVTAWMDGTVKFQECQASLIRRLGLLVN